MWRLRALSIPWLGRTRYPTWTAIVMAMVVAPSCAFPEYTFFVEDCENGKDDDLDGLIDCKDPSCRKQYECLPMAPYGWAGPIVVWRGSNTGKSSAPQCADSGHAPDYYDALYDGSNPGVTGTETCPECTCSTASPTNARCESRIEYFQDSLCSSPPTSAAAIGTAVGTTCTQISGLDSSVRYYKVEQPTVVPASVCAPVAAPPTAFPEVVWENILRPCRPTTSRIGDSQLSVRVPDAPFEHLVCVYKAGSAAYSCPSSAYRDLNFNYHEVLDQRSCTACACQVTGMTCQSSAGYDVTMADFGSTRDCSGQPRGTITASRPGCAPLSSDTAYPPPYLKLLNASIATSGTLSCSPAQSQFQGAVCAGQVVTICCDNLQH